MRYITAIKMADDDTEKHISLCLILNSVTGKTITWYPKTIAKKIDEGTEFRVASSDGPVEVVAVHRKDDDDYIRTKADGKYTNNLLALPYMR